MRVGFLGIGTWGCCLANMLSRNGANVICWGRDSEKVAALSAGCKHRFLGDFVLDKRVRFTDKIEEVIAFGEVIVESVSIGGVRVVIESVKDIWREGVPLVMTSKGIEQSSLMLPHEIVVEVLGYEMRRRVGVISGPSIAAEVMRGLPTAVVCAACNFSLMESVVEIFSTSYFRVYPNSDINGVTFGGAAKNVVAIMAGFVDAMDLGCNAKASIITRGLHEMKKLCSIKHGNLETLNGLAGVGDLVVTSLSPNSRNYRFGQLIARGYSCEDAKKEIGAIVEGAYTLVSLKAMSSVHGIPTPLIDAAYGVIYEKANVKNTIESLMNREVKEERL